MINNNLHLLSIQYQLQATRLLIELESIGEWDKENPWVRRSVDGKFVSNASVAIQSIQKFIDNLGDQIQSQVDGLSTQLKGVQQEFAERFKEQPILHDAILGEIKPLVESVPVLGEMQRLFALSRTELEKLGQNKVLATIGNAVKASLPVAGAIALAVVPELAVGMLLNESLVTVAASLGIGQVASFAVRKGAEKLDIKDKRVLALVDIVTGLAANSVAKMGFSIFRKTLKEKLISEHLRVSQEATQAEVLEKIRRELQVLKNNKPNGIRDIFSLMSKNKNASNIITKEQATARVNSHIFDGSTGKVKSRKDVEDLLETYNQGHRLELPAYYATKQAGNARDAEYSQGLWLGYLINQRLGVKAAWHEEVDYLSSSSLGKINSSNIDSALKIFNKTKSPLRLLRDKNGVVQATAEVKYKNDSIYIEYLTTAPWNYIKDHPNYTRGSGSLFIEHMVKESLALGKEGRITLSAVPSARTFYEQIGFRYNSLAQKKRAIANDNLFEMTLEPEQALRFVQARTNIRNLVQKLDKPVQASATSDENLRWMEMVAIVEESIPWQLGVEKPPSLGVIKHLI